MTMTDGSGTEPKDLLTPAEKSVLDTIARVWGQISTYVIDDGPSRDNDLLELGVHFHAIQNMILAQAAARAYPDRFRLLGEQLR